MGVAAAVLEAPRRLLVREFDRPAVGDDDAVLRVEACGLCGTDHEQFTGVLPTNGPTIPGHEAVGVIEEIGTAAASRWGVAEGDLVAVAPFQSCGRCDRCQAREERRCRHHGLRDAYGFAPVADPPSLWGGYATHQYLAPDSQLLPVPPGMDPVIATLFNPLGAGIRWAVTVPGTKEGDRVAILGPGIRGLCSVAAVKDAGASFVMVTGFGEHDRERLELAKRFGADATVDVASADPRSVERNFDVVVDVTAKAPAAFGQAIDLVRPGGTVVVAGTRGSSDTPGFSPDTIVYKECRVVGAFGVDLPEYRAALELLATGRYPFAELPRRVAGLDEADALLTTMAGEGDGPPPVHGVVAPSSP